MGGSVPIDRSTTWPYEDGEPGEFSYARFSSPTVAEAERALGELDGGEALLFASGAAASAAVVLALLSPGQTVALAEGAYYGTGVLLSELERWGVRHVEFDQTRAPPSDADLIWIEAPSNPFLTMPDFEAAVAHSAARRLRLDRGDSVARETARARLRDRPALGDQGPGRPRRRPRWRAGGRAIRKRRRGFENFELGPARSPPPMSPGCSYVGSRPSTCASPARPRAAAHSRTSPTTILAVEIVRYPGFGPLMSFDVADADAARRVETSTRLIANKTSLGGVTSRIEARSRWEGERVPAGLLRLSVGLEDPEELWDDLAQALAG